MTLQKILLKLSRRGAVQCFCSGGQMTIELQEWYYFNTIFKIKIDLNEKIDVSKFSQFIK